MIRGAIDNVTPREISGWLYGSDYNLRGRKVLAFFDDTCIGAGEIGDFRQDLVDAGLGDGFHGFRFEINPPDKNRLGSIIIRVEGDETTLIQKESRVVGRYDPPDLTGAASGALDRGPMLQWMHGRGWIDQSQFDFLWYLEQLGVYNRTLAPSEQAAVSRLEEGSIAVELLELFHMAEIMAVRRSVRTGRELAEVLRSAIAIRTLPPLVAVWSAGVTRYRVVEGSHRDLKPRTAARRDEAFTNYALGPNRLLFLNARCQVDAMVGEQGAAVFFASGLRGSG